MGNNDQLQYVCDIKSSKVIYLSLYISGTGDMIYTPKKTFTAEEEEINTINLSWGILVKMEPRQIWALCDGKLDF